MQVQLGNNMNSFIMRILTFLRKRATGVVEVDLFGLTSHYYLLTTLQRRFLGAFLVYLLG